MSQPAIVGILNVTPDSFSDGGQNMEFDTALASARRMVTEGAAMIDVGGESTRPGADDVSEKHELERVVPLVARLAADGILVSVDTSKPEVMRQSVAAGAFMINDVRALREPDALETAVELGVPVCLMHMQGQPRSMQMAPFYVDVVAEVTQFLRERVAAVCEAGLPSERIVIDPGFGFGKNLTHNLTLLNRLRELTSIGCPLLVGLSRKSMFEAMLGAAVDDRVYASVAAALLAVERGAALVRVHDVRATAHALGVYRAVRECSPTASPTDERSSAATDS